MLRLALSGYPHARARGLILSLSRTRSEIRSLHNPNLNSFRTSSDFEAPKSYSTPKAHPTWKDSSGRGTATSFRRGGTVEWDRLTVLEMVGSMSWATSRTRSRIGAIVVGMAVLILTTAVIPMLSTPSAVPSGAGPLAAASGGSIKLRSAGIGPTTVSLYWTYSSGGFGCPRDATCGISLKVSYPKNGSSPEGIGFAKSAGTAYAYGATPGVTYAWQVTWYCFSFYAGPCGTVDSNILRLTQPAAATLSYTQPSSTSAQFIWNNNAAYGGLVVFGSYQVMEAVNGGPYSAVTTITAESTMTYTVNGLLSGSSYSFYLNTTDQCSGCPGGTYPSSSFSNIETLGAPVPPSTYSVTFTESGLHPGTSWSVTLDGVPQSATASTITFSEADGTYAYTVGSVAGYTANPSSGSVTVNGAGVSASITFTAVPPTTYDVSFTETGLPTGTSWSVTLAGTTHTSTASTITFSEGHGIYAYTISVVPGYATPAYTGSIDVHGSSVTQSVAWTQVTYAVTFEESALPAGSSWSVSLQGTVHSSTTTNVVFNEPNGSYSYTVSSASGYTSRPSSGTTTVNGKSVTQAITFSVAPSGPTIGSFSASASTITLGSSVTFTVTAAGGAGALSYAYAGLPSGCSSANVSALTCTPTVTGSFAVEVTVTDPASRSTTATVTLTVNPPGATEGGSAGNTILGLPASEAYAVFAAIAIAIVVGGTVAVVRSRRKRMMSPPPPPRP